MNEKNENLINLTKSKYYNILSEMRNVKKKQINHYEPLVNSVGYKKIFV
jgi:hypothetical protein